VTLLVATRSRINSFAPGLALSAVGVAIAMLVNRQVPVLSALLVALIVGLIVGNLGWVPTSAQPGIRFSAKRLLRVGIVLLGVQLTLTQILDLGQSMLAIVLLSVAITFVATWWVGRRMGLSTERSALIATGTSICGASAIVAMDSVVKGDEEDVANSLGLITLFGSIGIVALPLLQKPLGLSDEHFGMWAGASLHEVAQVVAAAGAVGSLAIASATLVKLTRVVLLAPMIAIVGLWMRRTRPAPVGVKRPPIVPLFVIGFLFMASLRTAGVVPEAWLAPIKFVQVAFLSASMFALGSNIKLKRLFRGGGPSLILAAVSTMIITVITLLGISLLV
jgi:uncharacterized integral membrane protein (TIGR00698 family)